MTTLDPHEMSKFCMRYYSEGFGLPSLKLKELLKEKKSARNYIKNAFGIEIVQYEHLVRTTNEEATPDTLSVSVFSDLNLEVGRFESIANNIFENLDAITSVFSNQKLRFADGKIDFYKILKILNKNFSFGSSSLIIGYGYLILAVIENITAVQPDSVKSAHQKGQALEFRVERLYRAMGCVVHNTPMTGDFGVDLLISTNIEKIAVQCKSYSAPIGVDAVMQVHSGGHYYNCTRFAVFSTNGYTQAAAAMAEKLKVELFTLPRELD